MPPSSPSRVPTAMPQWHWQPWGAPERAQAGGAWEAAHAWLAALPGVPAGALPLHRDAHGRPRFAVDADADADAADAADAGWSHSGDGLLLAFVRGAVLGVDMEYERPRPNALALARRYFTPAEADWLEAQPADRTGEDAATAAAGAVAPRDLAFLRLWCAKEAVLKAHGRGLAFGLHRLAFAERDGALVLVAADPALGDATAWQLREFIPHAGYRAALAWR